MKKSIIIFLSSLAILLFGLIFLLLQNEQKRDPKISHLSTVPIPETLSGQLVRGERLFEGNQFVAKLNQNMQFSLWESREYSFTSTEITWDNVKQGYSPLLADLHFKQDDSILEEQDGYRLIIWNRSRDFGLAGESFAVIWVEEANTPPMLILATGLGR